MPGFPNTTSVTVSDVMATIDPAVGNVPKMYVWLVNIATNTRYGPSAATDSGGNWSLAAVPQGIYETFYAGESPAGVVPTLWTTAGAKGYLVSIASNPPTQVGAGSASGQVVGKISDTGGQTISITNPKYAVKGDGNFLKDATIASGQALVTSASITTVMANPPKQGQLVSFIGAGAAGIPLVTTILSVNLAGGTMTLNANAGTAVASGGIVFFATDDTTGIQSWLNDLQTAGAAGDLPWAYYGINAVLSITQPCHIRGQGIYPLYGSNAVNVENVNMPTVAPYLSGTVLWQFALATNAINMTGAGISPRFDDFGVMFASLFTNTGHGWFSNPPAYLTAQDNGLLGSSWKNLYVFGHDGNHYGYWLTNPLYVSWEHLYSAGGGGYVFDSNVTAGGFTPGNMTISDLYAIVMVGGSAHGIYFRQQAGVFVWDMTCFIRPQVWVRALVGNPFNVTAPTSAQKLFATDGHDTLITQLRIVNPDFETNVSSTCHFPTGHGCGVDPAGLIQGSDAAIIYADTVDGISGTGYRTNGVAVKQDASYLRVTKSAAGAKQISFGLTTTDDSLYIPGILAADNTSEACTAAAGANAGTTPPAPALTNCTKLTGRITFGTGTTPAAGAQVVVTYPTTLPFSQIPNVMIEPNNALTQALGLYVTGRGSTGFTVSCANAPAAGQANTTYDFSYIGATH